MQIRLCRNVTSLTRDPSRVAGHVRSRISSSLLGNPLDYRIVYGLSGRNLQPHKSIIRARNNAQGVLIAYVEEGIY